MSPESEPRGALTRPEAVRAVADDPDPARRNLAITLSYHQLSRALAAYFGRDVVWCAFATWASKQAGCFIRNEEVPGPLRRLLGLGDGHDKPASWTPRGLFLTRRFLRYARLTADDVSRHVAAGNQLVYRLLAPLYAELLEALDEHGAAAEGEARRAFFSRLEAEVNSDDELRRAFASSFDALAEDDPDLRAERLFLANALVGLHEQRRLQEAIEGSLSAPIRRALDDPERRWSELPLPLWLRQGGAWLFRTLFALPIRRFEADWQEAVTRSLMTMGLAGGGRLELGQDLPPLADGSVFPPALAELRLPEVEAMVGEFDRTPHTTRGSAARNWARLADRMNYIVDFFRSRQQAAEMLAPPFTVEQAAAIVAGQVPPGPL
jgi:hypothetical protein